MALRSLEAEITYSNRPFHEATRKISAITKARLLVFLKFSKKLTEGNESEEGMGKGLTNFWK